MSITENNFIFYFLLLLLLLSHVSHVWFFATPWTAAHQTPLSMGFSRQEYWSGLPFPLPFWLLLPPKPKTNKQVEHAFLLFQLLPTQSSTFANLTPLPQFAREKKATLSTVPHQITMGPKFAFEPRSIGHPFQYPLREMPLLLPARSLLLAGQI